MKHRGLALDNFSKGKKGREERDGGGRGDAQRQFWRGCGPDTGLAIVPILQAG